MGDLSTQTSSAGLLDTAHGRCSCPWSLPSHGVSFSCYMCHRTALHGVTGLGDRPVRVGANWPTLMTGAAAQNFLHGSAERAWFDCIQFSMHRMVLPFTAVFHVPYFHRTDARAKCHKRQATSRLSIFAQALHHSAPAGHSILAGPACGGACGGGGLQPRGARRGRATAAPAEQLLPVRAGSRHGRRAAGGARGPSQWSV